MKSLFVTFPLLALALALPSPEPEEAATFTTDIAQKTCGLASGADVIDCNSGANTDYSTQYIYFKGDKSSVKCKANGGKVGNSKYDTQPAPVSRALLTGLQSLG